MHTILRSTYTHFQEGGWCVQEAVEVQDSGLLRTLQETQEPQAAPVL